MEITSWPFARNLFIVLNFDLSFGLVIAIITASLFTSLIEDMTMSEGGLKEKYRRAAVVVNFLPIS